VVTVRSVLLYDISSDRVRPKVADACLDYGLERIQYSAFFGEISANHLDELLQRIRRIIDKTPARVEVFPICEKDLRLRRTLKLTRLQPPRGPGRPPAVRVVETEPAVTETDAYSAVASGLARRAIARRDIEPAETVLDDDELVPGDEGEQDDEIQQYDEDEEEEHEDE
jgi:CRISPR-associated protein Cas2